MKTDPRIKVTELVLSLKITNYAHEIGESKVVLDKTFLETMKIE